MDAAEVTKLIRLHRACLDVLNSVLRACFVRWSADVGTCGYFDSTLDPRPLRITSKMDATLQANYAGPLAGGTALYGSDMARRVSRFGSFLRVALKISFVQSFAVR